jgi:5-methylcytosine-specific restriction endonuclease McrA
MTDPLPKTPASRLDSEGYLAVRNEVLQRDGWKCQLCGSMRNLEVHHQKFRSRSGEDTPDNLITLCVICHTRMHRP